MEPSVYLPKEASRKVWVGEVEAWRKRRLER